MTILIKFIEKKSPSISPSSVYYVLVQLYAKLKEFWKKLAYRYTIL